MSDIEEKIDELYQLAPGEFTAARNALAKTLKGADAARVKASAKPTAVPWAINQLYWHQRSTYDRLLAAGRALRDAQIAALGGRGGHVGGANEAHGKALADAVRDATALASAHGIKPAVDQLARMLEMLSLRQASAEAPGRYTDLVRSSGLEALVGISLAESTGSPGGQTGAPGRDDTRERPAGGSRRSPAAVEDANAARRREEEAAAARKQAEERLRAAERALERAREIEAAAERDVAEADAVLERAQRAADAARRARRAASEALTAARVSGP